MNYKYLIVWLSYDKVAAKMTKLSKEGYEYDRDYAGTIIRMKKTDSATKIYKFIYDKSFTPEIVEYYKASGWQLHKFKIFNYYRLAEGNEKSYPIFSDLETEYEIVKYRLLRMVTIMLLAIMIAVAIVHYKFEIEGYLRSVFGSDLGGSLMIVLSGFFGGISGFGLAGTLIFTPKYFRLKRVRKEEFEE